MAGWDLTKAKFILWTPIGSLQVQLRTKAREALFLRELDNHGTFALYADEVRQLGFHEGEHGDYWLNCSQVILATRVPAPSAPGGAG